MPTLPPLLATAPEPTPSFSPRLLALPAALALLGMAIAFIAVTTGQDYRRDRALLQLRYDRAHAEDQLAQAQLQNADPSRTAAPTDIAPLQTALDQANAAGIISYAKYGRQFTSWDGYRYEEIVEQGYVYQLPTDPPEIQNDYGIQRPGWPEKRTKNVVWYPLYPALGWLVSHTLNISANHALTAVSWTCCLLASLITFLFARRHFFNHIPVNSSSPIDPVQRSKLHPHDLAALWVLAALLFGPCSIFLYANFTESLFLLLLATFLYCLQGRWWWRAALVAAIASACRSQGVLFGPILALTYLLRTPEARPLNKLATATLLGLISALGLACYMLFLQHSFGDPLAFMHAQKFWNVGLGPAQLRYALNPLNALAHIKALATAPGPIDWPRLWESLCLLWPSILLVTYGRRTLTFELQLFAWILWGLPYISNSLAGYPPLDSQWMSMGRFTAVMLPIPIILAAQFQRRPWLAIPFFTLWTSAFAIFAFKFGIGDWIG